MAEFHIEKLFEPAPILSEFFREGFITSLKYPEDKLETAVKLISLDALSNEDELSVEEVFDYLSHKGFQFLFPKILQAYLENAFELDGNFALQFTDSVWGFDDGADRKHGRGNRMDMFSLYKKNLSEQNRVILESIIRHLTK